VLPLRKHRPRILFLTCHLPWPAVSGGRLRELELIRRLADRFEIHLLVISKTPRQDLAHVGALERLCSRIEVFGASPAGADPDLPAQVLRHHRPPATGRVEQILARGEADLVHVEGFYLMQHIPEPLEEPVLLVEQNIEYELERQRAAIAAPVTRLDAFAQCTRTQLAEVGTWLRATRLGAVTVEDRKVIRRVCPSASVHLVPDGADHIPAHHGDQEGSPFLAGQRSILLVANFGYAPNVDAAIHSCNDILPAIHSTVADAKLWLIGNAPPAEVRALAGEHVRVTGRVMNVVPYLDRAEVVVCPLRIGGGIKVKMIEALRRGKAIVSTSVGAQGLPAPAAGALLIADHPGDFGRLVLSLLCDPLRRERLERQARAASEALPTWDDGARALAAAYDDLLDQALEPRQPFRVAAGSTV
jgi:polysaccharide biosynthesis protein PslH